MAATALAAASLAIFSRSCSAWAISFLNAQCVHNPKAPAMYCTYQSSCQPCACFPETKRYCSQQPSTEESYLSPYVCAVYDQLASATALTWSLAGQCVQRKNAQSDRARQKPRSHNSLPQYDVVIVHPQPRISKTAPLPHPLFGHASTKVSFCGTMITNIWRSSRAEKGKVMHKTTPMSGRTRYRRPCSIAAQAKGRIEKIGYC